MSPQRIQLSRKKGWRLASASSNPNGVVIADRRTEWGNPFRWTDYPRYRFDDDGDRWRVPDHERRRWSVVDFEAAVRYQVGGARLGYPPVEEIRERLKGKDLACWCAPGDPCHADILLAIANEVES